MLTVTFSSFKLCHIIRVYVTVNSKNLERIKTFKTNYKDSKVIKSTFRSYFGKDKALIVPFHGITLQYS